SRTASAQRTSDESFLRRTLLAGSSSMATTSPAWSSSTDADVARASRPSSRGATTGSWPTSSTEIPASAASRAPATTSSGARSPPMASTATTGPRRARFPAAGSSAGAAAPPTSAAFSATFPPGRAASLDLDGLAPAVPPAVGADHVGQLRLVAVGADRAGGGGGPPVRGPPAAALGLARLPLGDGHRGSYSSVRFGAVLDVIADDQS